MVSNNKILENFTNGEIKGKNATGSLFIEHDTIYSYGYHYPLARRVSDNKYIVNNRKVSKTTSRHANELKGILATKNAEYKEVSL